MDQRSGRQESGKQPSWSTERINNFFKQEDAKRSLQQLQTKHICIMEVPKKEKQKEIGNLSEERKTNRHTGPESKESPK